MKHFLILALSIFFGASSFISLIYLYVTFPYFGYLLMHENTQSLGLCLLALLSTMTVYPALCVIILSFPKMMDAIIKSFRQKKNKES